MKTRYQVLFRSHILIHRQVWGLIKEAYDQVEENSDDLKERERLNASKNDNIKNSTYWPSDLY